MIHFHKWSEWTQYRVKMKFIPQYSNQEHIYFKNKQERQCLKCNKHQEEDL